MGRRWLIAAACLAAGHAAAQSSPDAAGETVRPAFRHALPNVPGKSLVAVTVDYAPGGASPPHRHAHSAFIVGYVLSGAIESQVDDGPVRVFRAGESFREDPGAHHRVSRNASASEPARLLAVFVLDTDERALTVPDAP